MARTRLNIIDGLAHKIAWSSINRERPDHYKEIVVAAFIEATGLEFVVLQYPDLMAHLALGRSLYEAAEVIRQQQ